MSTFLKVVLLVAACYMYGQVTSCHVVHPRYTDMLSAVDRKNDEWQNKISETDSLEYFFIEVVTSKERQNIHADFVCIQVFERPGRRFIQEIDLQSCENCFWWDRGIQRDDYNFDGFEDFSLYVSSITRYNTISLYFLYDPAKRIFVDSGFTGTSLEFDKDTKTIYEWFEWSNWEEDSIFGWHSEKTAYKLVDHQMIFVEKHCFKSNNEVDIEVECEE